MERIYIRGSDDRINTDNQLNDLKKASPDAVLYEDMMSGSKKRPHLERMIKEVQPGDVVWIWSLDRLSREGIHATLEYLQRLTTKKVRVRSFKESWLDSENPCYEILVSCMAFAAKMERDRLIERTTAGIRRSRQQTGRPVLDKKLIAEAPGSLREVADKFKCSAVYVLKCRRELGRV
jgi:DNA invertase Pin-like site-specific DNA recombinase